MLVSVYASPKIQIILTFSKVCINQADNQEKSQQVRIMGKVYLMACTVRVWLGPTTDEEMDAVFPLFDRGSACRTQDLESIPDILHFFRPLDPVIESFFSRSWFTRRWILQEVFLARAVVVHCGHYRVPWDHLHERVSALPRHMIYDSTAASALNLSSRLQEIRTLGALDVGRRTPQADDISKVIYGILTCLHTHHTSDCVDERDRLYALYGLIPSTRPHSNQPAKFKQICSVDYGKHFSEIYTNFAATAVEFGLFDQILEHMLEFGALAHQKENWPSWVPSWNRARRSDGNLNTLCRRRTPLSTPELHSLKDQWGSPDLDQKWIGSNVRTGNVYGLRALYIDGCVHRIDAIRPDTCHLDAVAYFEDMLSHRYASRSSVASKLKAVWLVMVACDFAPFVSSSGWTNHGQMRHHDTILWMVLKKRFGLLSDAPDWSDLDEDKVLSKAKQSLKSMYPFCYEHRESLTFGLAYVQVEPGDFVFRISQATGLRTTSRDQGPPTVCGLILRPCHQASVAGPATFKLVGMCIDYFPIMERTDIVDVILV